MSSPVQSSPVQVVRRYGLLLDDVEALRRGNESVHDGHALHDHAGKLDDDGDGDLEDGPNGPESVINVLNEHA